MILKIEGRAAEGHLYVSVALPRRVRGMRRTQGRTAERGLESMPAFSLLKEASKVSWSASDRAPHYVPGHATTISAKFRNRIPFLGSRRWRSVEAHVWWQGDHGRTNRR